MTLLTRTCFLLGVVGLLSGCVAGLPPGQGAKPKAGFVAAHPVLAALAQYHQRRGHYPEKLDELVPGFLPDANTLGFVFHGEFHRFKYEREPGNSFRLQFVYLDHGGILETINECDYDARTQQWGYHRIATQF